MAEMVGSAVVQETVSRAVSFVLDKHDEKASEGHNIERLKMAHFELEYALEITKKLPIIDASLLHRRKMLKRAHEECGDVLHRCKLWVREDEEGGEQGVTARSSSFPKRIFHAVKSLISSSVSLKKDELDRSSVGRFEWFADKAGKFVSDVESGCSLAHYRFFSPLIRPLLEGKTLQYGMVQGSRRLFLRIVPACSQGRGVEARLWFSSIDLKMPTDRSFTLWLVLRLSESTDIIGITAECLQSLGPLFKSLAQVAVGELSQLPAQDVLDSALTSPRLMETSTRCWRPDPLCCGANAQSSHRANNTISSSEISYKFPELVIFMGFHCYIPAFDQHNLQSSPDGTDRNVIVRNWPPLELRAFFLPHYSWEGLRDNFAVGRIGGREVRIDGSLREMEEMVRAKAIDCFIRQPELTEYRMDWISEHGLASFSVRKPITESRGRSKTRRSAAKKRQ